MWEGSVVMSSLSQSDKANAALSRELLGPVPTTLAHRHERENLAVIANIFFSSAVMAIATIVAKNTATRTRRVITTTHRGIRGTFFSILTRNP